MFVLDNSSFADQLTSETFKIIEPNVTHTKFELTFFVKPIQKDIDIRIEYMSSLWHDESIHELLNEWCTTLKRTLHGQSLYSDGNEILGPKLDFTEHFDIFQRLPEYGETLAILTERNKYSYSDLLRKIGVIKENIRKRFFVVTGVFLMPDDVVPIIAQGSADVVIMCLGVLSAGAAYLPLDSTNPANRIRTILYDVGSTFYLTDKEINIENSKGCIIEGKGNP